MVAPLTAVRSYPTAEHLADADLSDVPWVAPPPELDSDLAARLLGKALVADVLTAAVDTGRSVSRLGVAVAQLAALTVARAAAYPPEEDDDDRDT